MSLARQADTMAGEEYAAEITCSECSHDPEVEEPPSFKTDRGLNIHIREEHPRVAENMPHL